MKATTLRIVLLAGGLATAAVWPPAPLRAAGPRPSQSKEEGGPRTLDEISIEGEVAMPQVLFITAREPYRFPDVAHRAYLVAADSVLAMAPLPFPLWIGRRLAPVTATLRWNDAPAPERSPAAPSSQPPSGGVPASQGRN